ncbi:hypothetical protein HDA32_002415 [Spinactinospora alkalitolerans]|uniref:Uncharacterized protein n=1 Tax=Spinactinospora alkalitolerans TaxID=687207 RepID=A0A852TV68_9ACTN|nr:hypothetical protein [Spinactinospora alkalitolerans]NYE47295.1 hypothetical protein [Spinactinospora alkalitolerans]
MAIIRAEHVSRLLNSADPDPVLIVHEGSADVVPESALGGPPYQGALRVVSAEELDTGDEQRPVSQEDVEALARRLDAAVGTMGG